MNTNPKRYEVSEEFQRDLAILLENNPAPIVEPPTWTKKDLMRDFQHGSDYTEFKATLAQMGVNKLISKGQEATSEASGCATLIDSVYHSLSSLATKQALGTIVGYAVQSKLEDTAKGKMVRSLGSNFILASIAVAKGLAIPPTIPISVFFTVIIYLHGKDKEREKKLNMELAERIVEIEKRIRQKSQAKIDARHRNELERFLLSNEAHDIQDNAVFGIYYYYVGKGEKKRKIECTLTVGDYCQIMQHIRDNLQRYVKNDDLLKACAYMKLMPVVKTKTLELTEYQEELLNQYLQDCKDADYGSDIEEDTRNRSRSGSTVGDRIPAFAPNSGAGARKPTSRSGSKEPSKTPLLKNSSSRSPRDFKL